MVYGVYGVHSIRDKITPAEESESRDSPIAFNSQLNCEVGSATPEEPTRAGIPLALVKRFLSSRDQTRNCVNNWT